jgi:hypothetical protein
MRKECNYSCVRRQRLDAYLCVCVSEIRLSRRLQLWPSWHPAKPFKHQLQLHCARWRQMERCARVVAKRASACQAGWMPCRKRCGLLLPVLCVRARRVLRVLAPRACLIKPAGHALIAHAQVKDIELEGLRNDLLILCDQTKRGVTSPEGSEERAKVGPRTPYALCAFIHWFHSRAELCA